MSACVVHTPPHNKLHTTNYTRERVLLTGDSEWRVQLIKHLNNHEIDIYDSHKNTQWELDHSFIATVIPFYFNNICDASALPLFGRHISAGKVIVACSKSFPFTEQVKAMCNFAGVPVLSSQTDLLTVLHKRLIQTEMVSELD